MEVINFRYVNFDIFDIDLYEIIIFFLRIDWFYYYSVIYLLGLII